MAMLTERGPVMPSASKCHQGYELILGVVVLSSVSLLAADFQFTGSEAKPLAAICFTRKTIKMDMEQL